MGALRLPASGLVYVDACVVIYAVERYPAYVAALQPLWEAAHANNIHLVSSALCLMETLVGPLKHGNAALVADYERLFRLRAVRLLPLTEDVLREAARLRATSPPLRAPDAMHAATAQLAGCTLFLTNDAGFRRVAGLPLAVLEDVLAS